MLYKDYDSFISFWQGACEYRADAELSALFVNDLMRSYEAGNFDKTLQNITNYIVEQEKYSNYLLLLSFVCEILITQDLPKLINESVDIFEKIDSKQSIIPSGNLAGINRLILDNIYIKFKKDLLSSDLTIEIIEKVDLSFKKLTKLFGKWTKADYLHEKAYISSISLIQKAKKQALEVENNTDLDNDSLIDNTNKTVKCRDNSDSFIKQFASVKWYQLIKKTQLLKKLLENGRNFESAIIYQDLEEILENFDPKEYFPGLFFDLFKDIAPKLTEIYRFTSLHNNSLQWHIAERLYKTDMDRFVEDLDYCIANRQNDDEFIPYESTIINNSDRRLVRHDYTDKDSQHFSFEENQHDFTYQELESPQSHIDEYQQQLRDNVTEQVMNDNMEDSDD
ncbi:type VI secretion system protein IglI family protein [Francisella philomiragia]|uniref:type VI secretion system protein IglI family protein n=1 Tax=Francisella philomiragia TaxID=28110 RepID=UPI00351668C0